MHGGEERPGEKVLCRLPVVFDVVVDVLVVGGGAFAPVQDLLAGQVPAEQLLVVVDVLDLHLLRSRRGCDVAATSRSSVPAGNAYDRSSIRSAPRAIGTDV
ncbi:hypothetical protein ACJ6WD_30290 [Streptomyces sp. VTCC 41912]|uniref:hypothetical protein n=1 Tax=Streptomyces sp. VTCC 41912 TaxID=3383243 RepID=UPI003896CC89